MNDIGLRAAIVGGTGIACIVIGLWYAYVGLVEGAIRGRLRKYDGWRKTYDRSEAESRAAGILAFVLGLGAAILGSWILVWVISEVRRLMN